MIDLPPPYDSILDADVYATLSQESKAQLRILASLPKEAKEAGAMAVEEALAADENIQKTLDEVKELGDSVIETDRLFEQVRVKLANVDNQHYEVDGRPLPKLEPTWVDYQKKWTRILWDSRKTAAETVEYIEEFVEFVVPNVKTAKTDEEIKKAQERLKKLAKEKNPSKERAAIHSDEFTKLKIALKEFKDKFDNYTEPVRQAIEAQIKEKEDKIGVISLQIQQCELWITATAIALGVTAFATGAIAVGIGIAFGPLSPVVFGIVLGIGAAAAAAELGFLIAKLSELRDLQNDRDRLRREIDSLTAQKKAVERVQADLSSQKATVIQIADRIDKLAHIWSMVASNATQLGEDLETAHSSKPRLTKFKKRVAHLEVNYKTLREALSTYATRIN